MEYCPLNALQMYQMYVVLLFVCKTIVQPAKIAVRMSGGNGWTKQVLKQQ